MKNDIFNFNRFGKYLVADLHNAYSNFGLSLLLMSIMGAFAYFVYRVFDLILKVGNEGFGFTPRGFIFVICLVVVMMTVAKKCYGQVTDRRGGANFIMLPVSTLEKTLSMLFVCCMAVPLVYVVISFGVDAIICAFDPSCGWTLLRGITNFWTMIFEATGTDPDIVLGPLNAHDDFAVLSTLANPLLYLDDVAQIALYFLLGALLFKSGKISKTIGCLILISIAGSMIVSPIMLSYFPDMSEEAANNFLRGFLSNMALWDTISDTVVNLLLCTAIFFRIKTIKL